MRFHCVACGETAGDAYEAFCKCGSLIDVEYDPARVRLEDSANPYVRFRDPLPLASTRDRLPSDARYSPAIHVKAQVRHFGMRDASFVDAFNHAAAYAAQHKLVSERGFFKSRPA